MHKKYETPELTVLGQADEVVMGSSSLGFDTPFQTGADFEFEQESL